jgi:hypothetical protein
MAGLATKAKEATDDQFLAWMPLIAEGVGDDLNMGAAPNRKTQSPPPWRLRGKTRAARWIAADALRELRNPATIVRIK